MFRFDSRGILEEKVEGKVTSRCELLVKRMNVPKIPGYWLL